jgi:serine phosphatase RsbU (regulator of sigma subunit)
MKRQRRESDHRVRGMGLRARFALAMTAALTLVMSLTAYTIYVGAGRIADNAREVALTAGTKFSRDLPPIEEGSSGALHVNGVRSRSFTYGAGEEGTMYVFGDEDDPVGFPYKFYVPATERSDHILLRLLFAIMAIVVLVGAGVALWVASQVTQPVQDLIEDVRQIAKGDLRHRTHAVGAGEIELLARAIDRMTSDLEAAQEAQLELSIRQREREVASGVREALLPLTTPLIDGYDLGAAFLGSADFGGDFHDFIERDDGKVGLLVCGVSGMGFPAALIGCTARSYLRSELEKTDDLVQTFRRVNRWLFADMRRGMFVTALYALLDPGAGRAQIVCAGHKVPLLRYDAEGGQIRVVHPEGIALGFDKGPVFDRRIQMVETPIEPGDRFVLTNSAPVELVNEAGQELGEKGFYSRVLKHATLDTTQFLKQLRRDLEKFAGMGGLNRDVSFVTVSRES